MLSLSAAMTKAFARDRFDPMFWFGITGVSSAISKPQTAALDPTWGHPVAVIRVDPIEAELDPVLRKSSLGSVIVTVAAEWIRPIILTTRLHGKPASIKLGSPGVDLGDFAPYFEGAIGRFIVAPDGKSVQIELIPRSAVIVRKQVVGAWLPIHPLPAILDILTGSGTPSGWIDTATFAYDYVPAISHYVVSRINFGSNATSASLGDLSVSSPTEAMNLINDLAVLCNGSVIECEDGMVRFIPFDNSVVDAHWTEDVHAGSVEVEEQGELLYNRATVNSNPVGGARESWKQNYTQQDTDSQSAHAVIGSTDGVSGVTVSTDWITGPQYLSHAISATDQVIGFHGALLGLWCGSLDALAGTQPEPRTVSLTRPIYIRIEREIVKITSLTFIKTNQVTLSTAVPWDGLDGGASGSDGVAWTTVPFDCFTGTAERGALGTTAAAQVVNIPLYDMTIQVNTATNLINRAAYGIDKIRVETGLDQYAVQLGDIVTLDADNYFAYGVDGLSSSNKWEVVSRRPDVYAGKMSWVLASAGTTSTTRIHRPIDGRGAKDFDATIKLAIDKAGMVAHVMGGETTARGGTGGARVSAGGSLTMNITPGNIASSLATSKVQSATGTALAANKDHHVSADILTGAHIIKSVPKGTPVASKPMEVALAKVVTNATAVERVVTTGILATKPVAPQITANKNVVKNKNFSFASKR